MSDAFVPKTDLSPNPSCTLTNGGSAVKVFLVATIICSSTLSGCASNTPISSLTPEQLQRAINLVEAPIESLQPGSYKLIGKASGLACMYSQPVGPRRRVGPPLAQPAAKTAMQNLRARAAVMNADGITNIRCEDQNGPEFGGLECSPYVKCRADAYTRTDQPTAQ